MRNKNKKYKYIKKKDLPKKKIKEKKKINNRTIMKGIRYHTVNS